MRISVRVIPRSRKNEVRWEEGMLRVHLTAAPVDGAANEALLKLLSARLDVPKSAFSLLQGTTTRQKVLQIDGLTAEDLEHKLR